MAVKARIEGLRELLAVLRDEVGLRPVYRAMMQAAGDAGADAARAAAPVATGKLRGAIKTKLHANDIPRYVVVKTTATRSTRNPRPTRKAPNPFPYGKTTNYAASIGRGKMNPNHRWFTNAVESTYPAIQGELDKVAAELARTWGR